MKKTLCALCCVGAMYAADTLNQVEINIGNTGSHKGLVNIQGQYKDTDRAAAKLFLGYQGFDKAMENGKFKDPFKTNKKDYELSAYLGKVLLDNSVTDLTAYLIGGYHFSKVKYGNESKSANGALWGAQLEVLTNITDKFRAGASAEYKNLYSSKKDFGAGKIKIKDDKVEVLAKIDVMVDSGVYVGGKIGMQKRDLSIGDSNFDKNQFVFFLTAGATY